MKMVPMQKLKRQLSAYVAEAAHGERIVVTKHNRPVVTLSASDFDYCHVGARFRKGGLKSLFRNVTKGEGLAALLEDRYGGRER